MRAHVLRTPSPVTQAGGHTDFAGLAPSLLLGSPLPPTTCTSAAPRPRGAGRKQVDKPGLPYLGKILRTCSTENRGDPGPWVRLPEEAYRVSKRRSYRGAAATCMICARRRHSVGRTDGRTCNGATRVILRRDQFLGVQTFVPATRRVRPSPKTPSESSGRSLKENTTE